jgi:hypothetical protein
MPQHGSLARHIGELREASTFWRSRGVRDHFLENLEIFEDDDSQDVLQRGVIRFARNPRIAEVKSFGIGTMARVSAKRR